MTGVARHTGQRAPCLIRTVPCRAIPGAVGVRVAPTTQGPIRAVPGVSPMVHDTRAGQGGVMPTLVLSPPGARSLLARGAVPVLVVAATASAGLAYRAESTPGADWHRSAVGR